MAQRAYKTLDDIDVRGKRVLVRADLNVPIENGAVTDTTRIERVAPTIRELAENGARVIVLSHFGRPKGKPNPDMSLKPLLQPLGAAIGRPVAFAADCVGPAAEQAAARLRDGDVLLLENARFHAGEEANSPAFSQEIAKLGALYVNDAFSAAHRAHATTEGLAHLLPSAAGRGMQAELDALERALTSPARPLIAVVGGAKVSTKLDLLGNLVGKVDALVIGGGMANTFLAALGMPVGNSLCEHELGDTARDILEKAKRAGCAIVLPADVVVAEKLAPDAHARTVSAEDVPDDQMILDIGTHAIADLAQRFETARTVVWNGPLGAFETPPFDNGTVQAARQVAMLTKAGRLVSIAGGGDTVAALHKAGVADDFTYVSTAGGAFLEWMEGKTLPGVAALEAAPQR